MDLFSSRKILLLLLSVITFFIFFGSHASYAQIKGYTKIDSAPSGCSDGILGKWVDDNQWKCDGNTVIHEKTTWCSNWKNNFSCTETKSFKCTDYDPQATCKKYDNPWDLDFGGPMCAGCFKSNNAQSTEDTCKPLAPEYGVTEYKCYIQGGAPNDWKVADSSHNCGVSGVTCYYRSVSPGSCSSSSCASCTDVNDCLSTVGCSRQGDACIQSTGCNAYTSETACTGGGCSWKQNSNKTGGYWCETKNSGSAASNQCEGYDNDSSAFKCYSSACGSSTAPWSESTSNSGVYSCSGSSVGSYCCKDPVRYGSPVGPQGSGTNPGSSTGSSPAPNTPIPNRSEALPCEFHNGQKNYAGAFCGSADGKTHESFDPSKARNGVFCSMTYIDAYDCNDGTTDYFPVAGNTTCSKSPWCPSKSTVTPSPTDAPGCITQGISCGPGNDCCASKNLVCVDPLKNGFFTCQYNTDPSKGPVGAFTPTPGTSGNCDGANFGHWGAGCACPAGGGCGPGTGCYPEASGAVPDPINNPKGQFCAASRWCAKSQTDVSGAAACATSSTYSSPTPTQKDLGYQADCPNTNVDGSANACVTGSSCPTGYTQHASEGTIGGTNGNQVCTEFEGGIPSVCCTRTAGGTAPVVSSAPTPTPVPFNPSTSKPTGPYIPFTSVGACPAGLEGYWKGTYCDTDKTYYDVYCEGGVPTRHPSGATCQ